MHEHPRARGIHLLHSPPMIVPAANTAANAAANAAQSDYSGFLFTYLDIVLWKKDPEKTIPLIGYFLTPCVHR
jgi:hypothetical protein